jgi:inhibitor of cysteine peptidase
LGFAATPEGQITGMKLTAYNTTVGAAEELQTFEFTSNITEERDDFTYYYAFSYGEALYNHKALMISPEHGLLGLGVTSWVYGWRQTDENESSESDEIVNEDYYYAYQSYYAIFKIDFNADQVIADPILIEHPESQDYYVTVDRGVYIDGVVHTLSNQRVISYDLNQDAIVQSLTLFEPDNRL